MTEINQASLLVELLTEELPPKALARLGTSFAEGIVQRLAARDLIEGEASFEKFATPRRLAVLIKNVRAVAPERQVREKVLPVSVALDKDGQPTPPLAKKLAALGFPDTKIEDLERAQDGKAEAFFLRYAAPGATLAEGLQSALTETLGKLPIPKLMTYQRPDGASVQFVRPVHGLIALHGRDIVPVSALGIDSGDTTLGHRFLSSGIVAISHADDYSEALRSKGRVVANFDDRRESIRTQLLALAGEDRVVMPETLLDEVNALVEWPVVYQCRFDESFLQVPQECLILTMRQNQKYFPLFDASAKLTNNFLIVSNMLLADSRNIVEGNQRVIRPRLADARFFFETDKKTKLADRVAQLGSVVYHNKLGTQLDRVERVRILAMRVAEKIGADPALADRAALLAKADLGTNMVGEFPELQGIMGRYYALADGENLQVAAAIGDQYRIRVDENVNTANLVALSLFVADRVETLVGIWGIGLLPTGEKDPFGLRRAALGLLSAFDLLGAKARLSHQPFPLRLEDLLQQAAGLFLPGVIAEGTASAVMEFVYERYRNQLASHYDRNAVEAVIALRPPLDEVISRIEAVCEFEKLPEASSLAAANKRIGNILKKTDSAVSVVDPALFTEPAEKALAMVVEKVRPDIQSRFSARDYAGTLKVLAQTREPVDLFFNEVMVMAEDPVLRANRISLLRELHGLMNQVADISRLAA